MHTHTSPSPNFTPCLSYFPSLYFLPFPLGPDPYIWPCPSCVVRFEFVCSMPSKHCCLCQLGIAQKLWSGPPMSRWGSLHLQRSPEPCTAWITPEGTGRLSAPKSLSTYSIRGANKNIFSSWWHFYNVRLLPFMEALPLASLDVHQRLLAPNPRSPSWYWRTHSSWSRPFHNPLLPYLPIDVTENMWAGGDSSTEVFTWVPDLSQGQLPWMSLNAEALKSLTADED